MRVLSALLFLACVCAPASAQTPPPLQQQQAAAPPDLALMAGLLHNVGSVYLLARAERHLDLFRNPAVRGVLMRDWQAPIGKAIAQNWGLPDEIAEAIGDQDQLDRHEAGARDLTDVLCVAVRAATFFERPDELEIALGSLPLFQRLNLGRQALHAEKLVLIHPATHRSRTWRAALPRDIRDLLSRLRETA